MELSIPEHEVESFKRRLLSPDLGPWSEQVLSMRGCSRPIRLRGRWSKVNRETGEVMSSHSTEELPTKSLLIRCKNRRASVCPSCSHEYKGDMWHLLSAGVAGGKGVPESVASHPMVFVTLTAPSFGAVHSATKPNSQRRCHPRDGLCEHGHRRGCFARHDHDEDIVGTPLCEDCYDYEGHVVWQWWAPELWRRFTIAAHRHLAHALAISEVDLRKQGRIQFAKVAEFQARGAIHFHALLRLDAAPPGPKDPPRGPFAPSDLPVTPRLLADVAGTASRTVSLHKQSPTGDHVTLRFGTQVDSRAVNVAGDASPYAVAAYLAKYSTKSTSDEFGPRRSTERRRHALHLREALKTLWDLDETGEYAALVKWSPILGFRGHISTKSRTFSTTLSALRAARADYFSDSANAGSTLMVGGYAYVASGWTEDEAVFGVTTPAPGDLDDRRGASDPSRTQQPPSRSAC